MVPAEPGTTPNYWCTWGTQNFAVDEQTFQDVIGLGDHTSQANALTEETLFKDPGWATRFYHQARSDLYILFDVGWDVAAGTDIGTEGRWRLGSLEVASDKFPSCTGTPLERLQKLNALCKEAGWRGAGLWIAAQVPGDGKHQYMAADGTVKSYFRERLQWCAEAGIEYWKVDYGARSGNLAFRQMLTQIAAEVAPSLLVEHARGSGPVNDVYCPWDTPDFTNQGSFRTWGHGSALQSVIALLQFSDVLRTYDVTTWLSIPTTLDRVAQTLRACSSREQITGILQCEDEPYIGAVLGCAIGLMRHPAWIDFPDSEYDPLKLQHRMDEVVRALRWQRIAPAWGVGFSTNTLAKKMLQDIWSFRPGDTWAKWHIGETIMQAAPALVMRDIAAPVVACETEPPYVMVSQHPNGSVAVGTLPRISETRGFYQPLADITINLSQTKKPIGVFGKFRSLNLVAPHNLEGISLWGQDLAGDTSFEISNLVAMNGTQIRIPGEVIRAVGLSAATPGDRSAPGMILKINTNQQR